LSFGAWQTTRKDHMATPKPIPVIDLFAGPGGLGEGFSSLSAPDGSPRFKLRVSIEKDPHAHRTLSLRALFRQFSKEKAPDCYYDRIRGDISQEALFAHPDAREAGEEALNEARHAELGTKAHEEIDARIAAALGDESDWVLIGGPPCQAYSLAGRSRRTKRVSLRSSRATRSTSSIKEYLRIIRRFKPAVFVMENVKGDALVAATAALPSSTESWPTSPSRGTASNTRFARS
jgi:DNA (cytosine-5)-methyltransferase 1